METLTSIFLNTEQEYIDRFCEEYKEAITTPDGFTIECKHLKETAKHFCCGGGKNSCFQPTRAQKVLWAKEILMDVKERKVLKDTLTGNLIFYFKDNKRLSYAVICSILENNNLGLISGFPVFGKRALAYENAKLPYIFFQK